MPAVDLLPLAGLNPGEAIEVSAWESHPLAPFTLTRGWWRAVADADSGPLYLDLWGVDTGDGAILVLHPGQRQLFRTLGGRLEGRLGLGPEAGRVTVDALRFEPVGPVSLIADFIARAVRIVSSGDFSRIERAAKAALSPDTPLSLRPSGASMAKGPVRPLTTDRLTGISMEGEDAATRASLDAQTGAAWTLKPDLTHAPDIWITLRAGDRLRAEALAQIAARFSDPAILAVYTDETHCGARTAKPAWDAELARHVDYVGRLVAWRAGVVSGPVATADAQSALAALAKRHGPEAIDRLALPLMERTDSVAPRPHASAPPLARSDSKVGVIVPTRDRPELIGPCLKAVLDDADHSDVELIVVDNGTRDAEALELIDARRADARVRILRIDAPFNYSALNNAGVREATGSVLVLLNNDVLPREPGWLSALAARASEPEIGAVGPLLLYPDHTIQHAGVALGIGGVAGHPWKGVPEADIADNPHLAWPQQRSALTGACLVMRREVFDRAGGFDEDRYPVTLNDVDLCLKIRRMGLRLVMEPRVRMIHHESKSRPSDRHGSQRARALAEQDAFRAAWGEALWDDPFYSPALTRADESGDLRG